MKGKGYLKFAMSVATLQKAISSSHWYIDPIATEHFLPLKYEFETFKELETLIEIVTARGVTYRTGIG
jgi:hypothetical protein